VKADEVLAVDLAVEKWRDLLVTFQLAIGAFEGIDAQGAIGIERNLRLAA